MKLKLIAAAVVLAATGAANAAIDIGATGNGDLFFTIWDGSNSYTRDLGLTIDGFQTQIAAPGSFSFSLAADALFTSFLSAANLTNLNWNITAADSLSQRRLIETYSVLPATRNGNDLIRSAVTATQSFALSVNTAMGSADSVIAPLGSAAYGGKPEFGSNVGNGVNFKNSGTDGNDSYANGLNLLRIDALQGGTLPSVYTPYLDEGFAVRAYLEPAGNLMISAVPEPETYALMLAGLALMGGIARRRRRQQP